MTYEERQKDVCQQCHSQRAIECSFVSRELASKCSYLQDVMYGWELGQHDTKQQMMKGAVEATVLENYDGKVLSYDEALMDNKNLCHCCVGDKVKVIIIKTEE